MRYEFNKKNDYVSFHIMEELGEPWEIFKYG